MQVTNRIRVDWIYDFHPFFSLYVYVAVCVTMNEETIREENIPYNLIMV